MSIDSISLVGKFLGSIPEICKNCRMHTPGFSEIINSWQKPHCLCQNDDVGIAVQVFSSLHGSAASIIATSLSLSQARMCTHTHTHTHTHKDFQDILSCKRKSVSSRGSDLPSTLTYATTNSFATKELSCWMAPSYMDMEAFQKSPHANFKKYTQKDWELFYLLLS